ncbi:MAG: HDIG domain-containing protein [Nitrospirota bacterium]|jgi:putative nucleotidyltransferase with HDIG domain
MKESSSKQERKSLIKRADPWGLALLVAYGLATALIIKNRLGVEEIIGSFLMATLLLAIFYRDILRYKPGYLDKFRMLALLGLLVTLTLGVGWLTGYAMNAISLGLEIDLMGAAAYAMPLAAGAMLVTLLFDFHTAIVFSFTISLLAGLWQAEAAVAAYAFVGSLIGSFSVIRCKRRSALVVGGLYVLAANVLTVVVLMLFGGELLTLKTPVALIMATISAVAVVAIISLFLPVLETLFKITTDISLLELLDLEQPLMKNLMIAAPGTYHHSIIVGNLVEAVAESVGVNPLFARVCAYYHDIGKIKMPEYFIENQLTGASKHEKLTPHMSSMILVSHVKEGVEMARQHKLPEPVIDVLSQHHGTTLITYFYEKAKGMPEGSGELSEAEYRYPGPKPQSRVAALIMIADAVEAASRVLTEPTPSRISALVDKIINHIFLAGQLDECDLTLKDIYEIRKRFTYILTGILHRRVDYPGFEFEGKKHEGHDKQQAEEGKVKQTADRA